MASLMTKAPPPLATDDVRWDAVTRREPGADGRFTYAVLTTGIYCRPVCPSRLPRRENTRFFADCDAAERAGFRACKRCHPRAPARAEQRAASVAAACRVIEQAEEPPSLDALAD